MLQIGSQTINTNIILAPLAGCTDLSFRLICREHGAEFCFYEMFDSNSLTHKNGRMKEGIARTDPKDFPIGAQLLGSDPEVMLKAAKRILGMNEKISLLDVNAACPVPKAIKKKSGAYLIKKPEKLYRIIDKLSNALSLPITIKLRTGFLKKDDDHIIQIALRCEQSGAKAIFVHGRTQLQGYSGAVDHASIKAIKDNVKIPVIASGNIFSAHKAKEMIDQTGCDGILVARGAFGHPWIFEQIKSYLNNGVELPDPSLNERLCELKKHLGYIEKYKIAPAASKVGYSRKVALWYLKSFKNAAALRNEIGRVKSFDAMHELIDGITDRE